VYPAVSISLFYLTHPAFTTYSLIKFCDVSVNISLRLRTPTPTVLIKRLRMSTKKVSSVRFIDVDASMVSALRAICISAHLVTFLNTVAVFLKVLSGNLDNSRLRVHP
jgi:hypothetical protein